MDAIKTKHIKNVAHVEIRTFGGFDVFADGRMVTFKQKKCKELLAGLVDKEGEGMSRAEISLKAW